MKYCSYSEEENKAILEALKIFNEFENGQYFENGELPNSSSSRMRVMYILLNKDCVVRTRARRPGSARSSYIKIKSVSERFLDRFM